MFWTQVAQVMPVTSKTTSLTATPYPASSTACTRSFSVACDGSYSTVAFSEARLTAALDTPRSWDSFALHRSSAGGAGHPGYLQAGLFGRLVHNAHVTSIGTPREVTGVSGRDAIFSSHHLR